LFTPITPVITNVNVPDVMITPKIVYVSSTKKERIVVNRDYKDVITTDNFAFMVSKVTFYQNNGDKDTVIIDVDWSYLKISSINIKPKMVFYYINIESKKMVPFYPANENTGEEGIVVAKKSTFIIPISVYITLKNNPNDYLYGYLIDADKYIAVNETEKL
jgi:hypothetical protein